MDQNKLHERAVEFPNPTDRADTAKRAARGLLSLTGNQAETYRLLAFHAQANYLAGRESAEAERDAARAEAWDEAVKALAWATENGPDPMRYVADNNPYRKEQDA